MISRVSENKTSGEIVRCRFPAHATIRRSRARSSQTAAQKWCTSHVHPCVFWTNWNDPFRCGGSDGNIFAVVEPGKNYHVNI
jgi:hypothetical protein